MPEPTTVPEPSAALTLRTGDLSVAVVPSAGGRIGQITVAGQPLLVDVPATDGHPMAWGSFPMAPWAGRIRGGRFSFEGTEIRLGLNHEDAGGGPGRSHSIHGTVFTRSWQVDSTTPTSVTMSCPLAGALDWPFGGTAHQRIEVGSDHVRCELSIDADDDGVFPAEIGWHPWFRKPDRFEFEPTAMYRRDDVGIPTGELVEPTSGPWDDCFVANGPVRLHYERSTAATVSVDSDCDHWVVFDEPADATCVEPQSGPPDALNLGPHVVGPETPLRRWMTISW